MVLAMKAAIRAATDKENALTGAAVAFQDLLGHSATNGNQVLYILFRFFDAVDYLSFKCTQVSGCLM